MAYTSRELEREFWLLTSGILQDSRVDTQEVLVIKRWLEEHGEGKFKAVIAKIDAFLADGYIGIYESKQLIDSLGLILREMRNAIDNGI